MGNTASHAKVASNVIQVIKQYVPSTPLNKSDKGYVYLTDEDYVYLKLGNWLTDVSQLCDPYAYISKKRKIWEKLDEERWEITLKCIRADDCLDEVLGKPGIKGTLCIWARHLITAICLEKYRKKGASPQKIEEAIELEFFQQYYPHQHLDYPPRGCLGKESLWEVHSCNKDPQKLSNSSSQPRRRVPSYLEEQIMCVAELLGKIEEEWKNLGDKERLLLLFGHACHIIEDFYFHSNFVEFAWDKIQGKQLPDQQNTACYQRLYYRRRLEPLEFSSPDQSDIDHTNGTRSSTIVYTGSFGERDIDHTIADIMEPLWDHEVVNSLKYIGDTKKICSCQSLKMLITPEGRDKLRKDRDGLLKSGEKGCFRRLTKEYECIMSHEDEILDGAVASGLLHKKSAEHIKNAFAIDNKIKNDYETVYKERGGIFAAVIGAILDSDEESKKSKENAQKMDESYESNKSKYSTEGEYFIKECGKLDNGSSSERVGSHSLIAKDSVRKQPFYQQALNLATYVSCATAHEMFKRLSTRSSGARFTTQQSDRSKDITTLQISPCIDWLHFLQHYLCHPEEAEDHWFEKPLLAKDCSEVMNIARNYSSNSSCKSWSSDENNLKKCYNDLAKDEEERWKKRREWTVF